MYRIHLRFALLGLAFGLFLTGCGGGGSRGFAPADTLTIKVTVKDLKISIDLEKAKICWSKADSSMPNASPKCKAKNRAWKLNWQVTDLPADHYLEVASKNPKSKNGMMYPRQATLREGPNPQGKPIGKDLGTGLGRQPFKYSVTLYTDAKYLVDRLDPDIMLHKP